MQLAFEKGAVISHVRVQVGLSLYSPPDRLKWTRVDTH